MHQASDRLEDGRNEESAAESRDAPVIESPPTAPQNPAQASPWWTAPAGKPVNIPDFGQVLLDTLRGLLAPQPIPVPIRIRSKR